MSTQGRVVGLVNICHRAVVVGGRQLIKANGCVPYRIVNTQGVCLCIVRQIVCAACRNRHRIIAFITQNDVSKMRQIKGDVVIHLLVDVAILSAEVFILILPQKIKVM